MPDERVMEKFRSLVVDAAGRDKADAIESATAGDFHVRKLMALLA